MNVAALAERAQALLAADEPEQAEALLVPHLASGSGPIPLWRALAQALRRQGRMQEVQQIQIMLVDMFPGDLTTRFDLAETLLTLGAFDRGWREYRHRYSLAHTTKIERKVQRPRWEGEAIPGRTLLIHDEQGFGDTFQFIRLVHWAKERSQASVIIEVNPESYGLIRRSFPGFEIVRQGELPPIFDTHCELMSLPMALGLQLAQLPGRMPYLMADPPRLEHWRARLQLLARPLVALAWAGRPNHPNDANRSITLDTLAPLAASGAQFVAVQKGPAAAQAAPMGLKLFPLSDEIESFEDTAAILCIADLLISVDSSPVHLAGALGRPAWVMLPFVAEWRWLQSVDTTPWYPQHRLFRQPRRGDWASVVAGMTEALRALGIQTSPADSTSPQK